MDLKITTLAERPELTEAIWEIDVWPRFMQEELAGWPLLTQIASTFPDFTLVATDDEDRVVARAHSVPFDAPGRVLVPGAISPVHCVPEHGHAVYVEPNVWIRHAAR